MKHLKIHIVLLLLVSVFFGQITCAETSFSKEYFVKSAFLYNFAKFVQWPAESFSDNQSPILLCILGNNPFGSALESIDGKTVGKRNLVVKYFETMEDIDQCHVLFISKSEKKTLSEILPDVASRHVLTVSDIKNFAQNGGIIGMFTTGKKIHFEINVNSAKRSGLQISSKLLKLAKIVNR